MWHGAKSSYLGVSVNPRSQNRDLGHSGVGCSASPSALLTAGLSGTAGLKEHYTEPPRGLRCYTDKCVHLRLLPLIFSIPLP
jgi:hypothetical protein